MPPGPKKMVVGFNHNIKYRGKTYHAQTEDSGADRPQVATHLFLGGNIIASKRTSYADICGAENLPDVVRALMEEQHKEVLRNLVHGVYDDSAPPAGPGPGLRARAGSCDPAGAPAAARGPGRSREHALRRGPDLGEVARRGDPRLPGRGRGGPQAVTAPGAR